MSYLKHASTLFFLSILVSMVVLHPFAIANADHLANELNGIEQNIPVTATVPCAVAAGLPFWYNSVPPLNALIFTWINEWGQLISETAADDPEFYIAGTEFTPSSLIRTITAVAGGLLLAYTLYDAATNAGTGGTKGIIEKLAAPLYFIAGTLLLTSTCPPTIVSSVSKTTIITSEAGNTRMPSRHFDVPGDNNPYLPIDYPTDKFHDNCSVKFLADLEGIHDPTKRTGFGNPFGEGEDRTWKDFNPHPRLVYPGPFALALDQGIVWNHNLVSLPTTKIEYNKAFFTYLDPTRPLPNPSHEFIRFSAGASEIKWVGASIARIPGSPAYNTIFETINVKEHNKPQLSPGPHISLELLEPSGTPLVLSVHDLIVNNLARAVDDCTPFEDLKFKTETAPGSKKASNPIKKGTYTFIVTAEDESGNVSDSVMQTIKVEDTIPPDVLQPDNLGVLVPLDFVDTVTGQQLRDGNFPLPGDDPILVNPPSFDFADLEPNPKCTLKKIIQPDGTIIDVDNDCDTSNFAVGTNEIEWQFNDENVPPNLSEKIPQDIVIRRVGQNMAPTADAQTVFIDKDNVKDEHGVTIKKEIILEGSDPDFDKLVFSLKQQPMLGAVEGGLDAEFQQRFTVNGKTQVNSFLGYDFEGDNTLEQADGFTVADGNGMRIFRSEEVSIDADSIQDSADVFSFNNLELRPDNILKWYGFDNAPKPKTFVETDTQNIQQPGVLPIKDTMIADFKQGVISRVVGIDNFDWVRNTVDFTATDNTHTIIFAAELDTSTNNVPGVETDVSYYFDNVSVKLKNIPSTPELIANGEFNVNTNGWTGNCFSHGGIGNEGIGEPLGGVYLNCSGKAPPVPNSEPFIQQTLTGLEIGRTYSVSWDVQLDQDFGNFDSQGPSFGVFLDALDFKNHIYLSAHDEMIGHLATFNHDLGEAGLDIPSDLVGRKSIDACGDSIYMTSQKNGGTVSRMKVGLNGFDIIQEWDLNFIPAGGDAFYDITPHALSVDLCSTLIQDPFEVFIMDLDTKTIFGLYLPQGNGIVETFNVGDMSQLFVYDEITNEFPLGTDPGDVGDMIVENNRIFIADNDGKKIIARTFAQLQGTGSGTELDGVFAELRKIEADSYGNFYVIDDALKIKKYNLHGELLQTISTPIPDFQPTDIDILRVPFSDPPLHELYLTMEGVSCFSGICSKLVKLKENGVVQWIIDIPESLGQQSTLTVSTEEEMVQDQVITNTAIYVSTACCSDSSTIIKFSGETFSNSPPDRVLSFDTSPINSQNANDNFDPGSGVGFEPGDIERDSKGTLYISGEFDIHKFTPSGQLDGFIETVGITDPQIPDILSPGSLAVDAFDNLYVADSQPRPGNPGDFYPRILKFSTSGPQDVFLRYAVAEGDPGDFKSFMDKGDFVAVNDITVNVDFYIAEGTKQEGNVILGKRLHVFDVNPVTGPDKKSIIYLPAECTDPAGCMDTFTFQVFDLFELSNTAQVLINIADDNEKPFFAKNPDVDPTIEETIKKFKNTEIFSTCMSHSINLPLPEDAPNGRTTILEAPDFGPGNDLLALWRAEHNGLDSSPSGGHSLVLKTSGGFSGTIGDAYFGDGKLGEGFVFDGNANLLTGDFVDYGSGDLTVEAWIKPNEFTSSGTAVGSASVTGDDDALKSFDLGLSQSGVDLMLSGRINNAAGASDREISILNGGIVPRGVWSHIAMTFNDDTDEHKIYLNGIEVDSSNNHPENDKPLTSAVLATAPTFIGSWGHCPTSSSITTPPCTSFQEFTGGVDDVGIYDRALTQLDIIEIMGQSGSSSLGNPIVNHVFGVEGNKMFKGMVLVGDNFDPNPSLTIKAKYEDQFGIEQQSEFAPLSFGTNMLLVEAEDAAGNIKTCEWGIEVMDVTPPKLFSPAGVELIEEEGIPLDRVPGVSIPVNGKFTDVLLSDLGTVTATDNFESITPGNDLDSPYLPGEHEITWFAEDSSGNRVERLQTLTIVDEDLPQLIVPEEPIVIDPAINGYGNVFPVISPALSADDSSDISMFECSHKPGDEMPIGTTIATCVALDNANKYNDAMYAIKVIAGDEDDDGIIDLLDPQSLTGSDDFDEIFMLGGSTTGTVKSDGDQVWLIIDSPKESNGVQIRTAASSAGINEDFDCKNGAGDIFRGIEEDGVEDDCFLTIDEDGDGIANEDPPGDFNGDGIDNDDFDCKDGDVFLNGYPFDGVADECYDADDNPRGDRIQKVDEDGPDGYKPGMMINRDEDDIDGIDNDGDTLIDEDSSFSTGADTPAEFEVCNGAGTIFLTGGKAIDVTCGSAEFQVIEGPATISLTADGGGSATVTLDSDESLTFDPETGSVAAGETTQADIMLGSITFPILPGQMIGNIFGPNPMAPMVSIESAVDDSGNELNIDDMTPSTMLTFFIGGDGTVDLECSLDEAPFEMCSSPRAVNVGLGEHTFKVIGTDEENNSDSDWFSWEVFMETPETCGNGLVEPPEQCDDGNMQFGDGCTMCQLERNNLMEIGGTIIPTDTTPLLLAGAMMTLSWMIPVIVAGAGIGFIIIRRK